MIYYKIEVTKASWPSKYRANIYASDSLSINSAIRRAQQDVKSLQNLQGRYDERNRVIATVYPEGK